MNKVIFQNLRFRKWVVLLWLMAVAAIFSILPLCFTLLQDVSMQAESDVTYYARGSYDLLIRPQENISDIERELGIVHENYLGAGNGGISVEQWQSIKAREDIDIAAPVSSLGYFTGISTNFAVQPFPSSSTRYRTELLTTDNIHTYTIDSFDGILLESSRPASSFMDHHGNPPFDAIIADLRLMSEFSEKNTQFLLPNTYHLLVGIDPEEEEKLTGIAFDDISEASPSGGWGQTFAGEGVVEKVIPVMELRDWQVPLQTRIQVEELNIDPEQTAGYRQRLGLTDNEEEWPFYFIHQFDNEEYEKIFVELMNYPAEKTDVVNADLGPYLTPFMVDYESLVISQDGEVDFMVADGTNIGLVSLNSTPVFYRVSAVEYEIHGERLQVKQTGEDQGVPLYRQVEKQGKDVAESIEQEEMIPFILDPVGTFTIGEYEESLAASPLGFYQLAPVYYLGTEKEEKLEMTATVKPGSFVTAPAQGVTNIASAAAIKENPIDAIRVRVADIDGYTSEAAAKITQIAEEIEAMGLHVTVIAGASPQKMEVEVEGLGLVEEAWTTLGAAGTIISLWNSNNVLLSLSFLFVSIVYLIHRQRSWYLQAQKEMNIMYQLGWRAKEAVRIAVSEQLIMFLAAAVVSALILLIIKSVFQLSYIIFVWMLFLVLVTMVLSVLLISKQVRRCFHRQVDEKKRVKKRHPLSPRSYTVKNIHYFRKLIVHSFMQIVVISATAPLVYLSVGVTQEQAGITLLGQYINAQISELHIVLIIGAYILTMVTLTENIFSMLKTRKKEIGTFRSLGWKFRHIFHLYAAETALWTGAAICIGHGLCFIVYSLFFPITAKAVVLLLASSSGLFAMMFLCSSLVIYYYLRKNIEKITAYTSL